MSEKSATTYTVLYMCSKLRVPPHALLAQSREVAAKIASVEGLIWKIWIHRDSENAMGGVYLFANRESAEAYLKHPVIQALSTNPALISTESRIFEVEGSLSEITRAPFQDARDGSLAVDALIAGGL